jgi:hypothetical protein
MISSRGAAMNQSWLRSILNLVARVAILNCGNLFRVCVTTYRGTMHRNLVRIGLVFGYSLSYYRDIVRGVRAFAESRPRWTLRADASKSILSYAVP